MPPRRPTSSRTPASPSARPGAPASVDEDWAAPSSEEAEAGTPLSGDYDDATPRGEATRVGPAVADEEDGPADEDSEGDARAGSWSDEDDSGEATRAGPPMTLEILEGPDKGRRKRFKGVRMVLGRAKGIDVTLSDQSVSRRHVELVLGEGRVLLRDLGSGNGTRVNDERVDEVLLQHGDVIALGKTRIRLVDEQEQIRQLRAEAEAREAEEKRRKEEERRNAAASRGADVDPNDPRLNEATVARYVPPEALQERRAEREGKGKASPLAGIPPARLALGGGLAVTVLLLLGLILVVGRAEPEAPPPDPKEALAVELMEKAWEALRAEQYEEAIRLAERAEKVIPGSDAQGMAQGARKQLDIQQGLREVRGLMDESRFEDARAKLKGLPEGTAKSAEARRKLEAELEQREGDFLAARVQELLDARDPVGARQTLSRLPIVRQGPYLAQVADLETQLAQEAQQQEKQQRATQVASVRRSKERRAEELAEAFSPVERRFHGGEYKRAALECDRVVEAHKGDKEIREHARQLKRLIPQFQLNFEDGQRKYKANSMEASARPLRKAAELYRQIGFGGSLGESINEMLGSASLASGKAALARGDVAAAGPHFREALRLNPSDTRARDGLASLNAKLEELYLQAYVIRDRDPKAAARKFQVVIDAAPEDSDVRRKAETHLRALQP